MAAGRFEVEHVLKKDPVLLFTGQIRSVGNKMWQELAILNPPNEKPVL